ncbi:MAG: ABC transporter substrate-binding protein [Corynebacterium sp.]|nr:ABC transporter substrate-binding protein [Corynebacterium sp.]
MRKIFALVGSVAALSFGLVACGNKGTDEIAIAFPFTPVASFSPYSDDATYLTRLGIGETLVKLDADGVPQPWLAESFETLDSRTVRFILREGATFQNGDEVTAQAVVASLNNAYNASARPAGLGKNNLTFTAISDYLVEVTSDVADPILAQRFSDPGTVILASDNTGTGPFTLTSFDNSKAELTAYDSYWNGKAKLDHYTAEFITDGTTRANALRSGEVSAITAAPVNQLEQLDKYTLEAYDIPRMTMAYFNTASGVFSDPSQRARAAGIIDGDSIIASVYEGHASSADKSLFNPAAQWNAFRTPTGTITSAPIAEEASTEPITIGTYTDRAELGEVASLVAEQLRTVGYTVNISVADYKTQEPRMLAGDFDIIIGSRNYQLNSGDVVSYLGTDFSCNGSYNLARYCNAAIDARISDAAQEANTDFRYMDAASIGADIIADNAVVPIAVNQSLIARSTGLKNLELDPFERLFITNETE